MHACVRVLRAVHVVHGVCGMCGLQRHAVHGVSGVRCRAVACVPVQVSAARQSEHGQSVNSRLTVA